MGGTPPGGGAKSKALIANDLFLCVHNLPHFSSDSKGLTAVCPQFTTLFIEWDASRRTTAEILHFVQNDGLGGVMGVK